MMKSMSFTAADYERLPEGFPAELLEGMLVKEPAPLWRHQELVARLLVRLFRRVGPGRVVASPIDVFLDEKNVLQPDLVVVAEEDRGTLQTMRAPLPILVI